MSNTTHFELYKGFINILHFQSLHRKHGIFLNGDAFHCGIALVKSLLMDETFESCFTNKQKQATSWKCPLYPSVVV